MLLPPTAIWIQLVCDTRCCVLHHNWCRWGGYAWRISVLQDVLGKGNLGESTSPKQESPPFCANSTEGSNLIKVFTVIWCCCCFYKSLHTACVFQRSPQNGFGLSPLASLIQKAATCSPYLSTCLIGEENTLQKNVTHSDRGDRCPHCCSLKPLGQEEGSCPPLSHRHTVKLQSISANGIKLCAGVCASVPIQLSLCSGFSWAATPPCSHTSLTGDHPPPYRVDAAGKCAVPCCFSPQGKCNACGYLTQQVKFEK